MKCDHPLEYPDREYPDRKVVIRICRTPEYAIRLYDVKGDC